jgi:hypothetical protein
MLSELENPCLAIFTNKLAMLTHMFPRPVVTAPTNILFQNCIVRKTPPKSTNNFSFINSDFAIRDNVPDRRSTAVEISSSGPTLENDPMLQ